MQNAAFSRITRYRGFFNTSTLNLNDTMSMHAGQRALNFANQNFTLNDGESVFSLCEHPEIDNYESIFFIKFLIVFDLFWKF